MGCQSALYEWADSYDSKVCFTTIININECGSPS